MDDIKRRVKDFLKRNKMDYESIDIKKEYQIFLEDMQKGLDGKPGCLEMLPTYIPMNDEIPSNEPVIVMDAGGTNFRVAVVYFDDNKKPVIRDFANHPMPGVREEVTREEFLQSVVRYLEPIIHRSNKIGFCFSYAIEMLPSGDGILTRFSKEIKIQGMKGRQVGAEILQALKKAGYTEEKKIVLLNDTVSTLLGGKAAYADRQYESFIGFILGTGTNTCYIEKGKNLGKLKEYGKQYENMLINMESGAYRRAPFGKIDEVFDLQTNNPGDYLLEKKVSGAYLGALAGMVLKHAIEEGLFSEAFQKCCPDTGKLNTIDLSNFLLNPFGGNALAELCNQTGQKDRITLYHLFDCLVERSAKLIAINLIAVVLKTGKGKDPTRPVCITADGSTFYKLKNFRQKLEHYLKIYLVDELNVHYEFVKADNSNLTGSAIAALAKLG
ncbi:MAG: hexokinase family protein [Caldicoprobacterales bacterium]|nr:hexokinase [Clostridiales bacterium]